MDVYEKPTGRSAWLLGLVALRELLTLCGFAWWVSFRKYTFKEGCIRFMIWFVLVWCIDRLYPSLRTWLT